MPGQARIEDRVTVGLWRAIFQGGRNGRLEEMGAVEEGFGALGEESWRGFGILEEWWEDFGRDGVGGGQCERGSHYGRNGCYISSPCVEMLSIVRF